MLSSLHELFSYGRLWGGLSFRSRGGSSSLFGSWGGGSFFGGRFGSFVRGVVVSGSVDSLMCINFMMRC